MKNPSLSVFLLILSSQAIAQTWTTLDIQNAGRYDDVFFLNDSVGWTCNSRGESYKTTNMGENWALNNISSDNYMRCIEFMDADTGFCGGLSGSMSLFKSTNGGQNWKNITADIPGLQTGICGLSCPGGKVVYGCGVYHEPAYVIKSLDGGNSWQKINMSAYAFALVDILFINQDTGWVSGRAPQDAGGIILQTTNGGATWQTVHNTGVHGDYVWKLQHLDPQHFFGSIERDFTTTANTQILKSTNGGQAWQPILVKNTYHRIQAIGFITPELGWAGDNSLFETIDGGVTWNNINNVEIFGGSFNRFFRINAQKAFLSGDQIYRYNAASSASHEPDEIGDQEIHSLKVSPNPTSGDIQISINLGQKTQVILKIYAANGGFEEILWTGEHPAGEYLLQTSLGQKPAGTYVVYLKTHHGTQHTLVTVAPNK